MSDFLKLATDAALRAGDAILQIYARDFEVEFKDDESPLTEADKAAHYIICDALEDTGLPILSEESKTVAYEERKAWTKYWLVDPLDGTKEFIKKNGEFTVNIALIENGRPVMGVVYAPVLKTLYVGVVGKGAVRVTGDDLSQCLEKIDGNFPNLGSPFELMPCILPEEGVMKVVASRSHMNAETEAFIAELEKQGRRVELVSSGSSLKLCMVAEGSAEVYPRIAPTMEWDTAAAQAVVEASGGRVVKYDSAVPAASYLTQSEERIEQSEDVCSAPSAMPHALCPLLYNKENLLNPFFVVKR